MEELNKKTLQETNGGGGLSDVTNWVVETIARNFMRHAYDTDVQNADFMIYKM